MPASVFRNTGDGYSYVTLSDAEYEEYKTGALHHYIHTGQSKQDIVNFIKKNKVNTNNFDRDGHNALLVACKMQRFDLARHLVDKRRARVNTPERSKGITPLMYAAQNNDVPLCRYLISRKADINLVGKGILDSTALTLALTVNNGDVAKLLIERQAKIDVADSSGYTPLHLAAAYGRHKVVQMLIRRKAQVNRFTTKDGISPLMVAAQASSSGAENCAIALIAAKADPNLINMEGENAFIMALSRGTNLSLCAFLLAHTTSAAAGTRQHATRNTPLMLVCANFALRDLAVAILDKGGAINAKNEEGLTALMLTATDGTDDVRTARLLVANNAIVDERNAECFTALMLAARVGNIQIARLLIENQADVNSRNMAGYSSLDFACKYKQIAMHHFLSLECSAKKYMMKGAVCFLKEEEEKLAKQFATQQAQSQSLSLSQSNAREEKEPKEPHWMWNWLFGSKPSEDTEDTDDESDDKEEGSEKRNTDEEEREKQGKLAKEEREEKDRKEREEREKRDKEKREAEKRSRREQEGEEKKEKGKKEEQKKSDDITANEAINIDYNSHSSSPGTSSSFGEQTHLLHLGQLKQETTILQSALEEERERMKKAEESWSKERRVWRKHIQRLQLQQEGKKTSELNRDSKTDDALAKRGEERTTMRIAIRVCADDIVKHGSRDCDSVDAHNIGDCDGKVVGSDNHDYEAEKGDEEQAQLQWEKTLDKAELINILQKQRQDQEDCNKAWLEACAEELVVCEQAWRMERQYWKAYTIKVLAESKEMDDDGHEEAGKEGTDDERSDGNDDGDGGGGVRLKSKAKTNAEDSDSNNDDGNCMPEAWGDKEKRLMRWERRLLSTDIELHKLRASNAKLKEAKTVAELRVKSVTRAHNEDIALRLKMTQAHEESMAKWAEQAVQRETDVKIYKALYHAKTAEIKRKETSMTAQTARLMYTVEASVTAARDAVIRDMRGELEVERKKVKDAMLLSNEKKMNDLKEKLKKKEEKRTKHLLKEREEMKKKQKKMFDREQAIALHKNQMKEKQSYFQKEREKLEKEKNRFQQERKADRERERKKVLEEKEAVKEEFQRTLDELLQQEKAKIAKERDALESEKLQLKRERTEIHEKQRRLNDTEMEKALEKIQLQKQQEKEKKAHEKQKRSLEKKERELIKQRKIDAVIQDEIQRKKMRARQDREVQRRVDQSIEQERLQIDRDKKKLQAESERLERERARVQQQQQMSEREKRLHIHRSVERERLEMEREKARMQTEAAKLKAEREKVQQQYLLNERKAQLHMAEKPECVVCLDHEADCLFSNCGHVKVCMDCGAYMEDCPICRVKIEGKRSKVYL